TRSQRLNQAIDRLDARLQKQTDPDGWRRYFALDELRTQLAAEDALRASELAKALPNYYKNHKRAEWSEVRDVRSYLISLISAVETAAIEDLEAQYVWR